MKTLEHIARDLAGYDPQALSADMVNTFLAELVEPVTEVEELGIFAALDRVLAQDIISPISVPPHNNSAMDGFAFAGAQLNPKMPLTLKVIGTALAGKAWSGTILPGQCIKIMTGAIMPAGLDTVVPQEFVTLTGDQVNVPAGLLQAGDNRRCLGEDLMQGQPALKKGERLTPSALGLVASLGLKTVPVLRQLVTKS
jgi:molybdopterin molybdotransferase